MTGAKIPPPLRFSGWPAGMVNRGREEALPLSELGQQVALRAAVNVDLDDTGKPQRRPGYRRLSETPTHSLWAHPFMPYMLGVQANSLVTLGIDGSSTEVAELTAPPATAMSYAIGPRLVFYSNRHDSGMVWDTGFRRPWATECPNGQPQVEALTAIGGMDAGTYQVAVTFVDDGGRESGATLPVEIDVAADGGIQLTGFPPALTDGPAFVRVYCSAPNGETLFAVGDMPVGVSTYMIGAHTPGALLDKLFLTELPPGQAIAFHGGALHVAVGKYHFWGEPLMQGLTNRTRNYVRYDTDVTMMASAGQAKGSGLFVSVAAAAGRTAGRTYFLNGPDPKQAQRVIAHPHGAVSGSLSFVDAAKLGLEADDDLPTWVTDDGQIVVGLPSGQVLQLHAKTYAGPVFASGASIAMRERDGLSHLVAVLRGGATNRMATSDTADAEVWRNGVRVES